MWYHINIFEYEGMQTVSNISLRGKPHIAKIKKIENTRLVLNIAQVYPARLRKSKITRLAK